MFAESADERVHQCAIVRLFSKLIRCGAYRLRCLDSDIEKVLVDIQQLRFRIDWLVATIREVSVILRGLSDIANGKPRIWLTLPGTISLRSSTLCSRKLIACLSFPGGALTASDGLLLRHLLRRRLGWP